MMEQNVYTVMLINRVGDVYTVPFQQGRWLILLELYTKKC